MPVGAAVGGPVSAASLTRPLRGWTAPALRWAARQCAGPPSALQRARTDTAPCLTSSPPEGHSGKHRRRCALPVPLLPVTSQLPLGGTANRLPLLEVSGCAAPATGPLRSFLPSCKRLECNAAGFLRQGMASQRAPAGRLPGVSHLLHM